MPWWSWIWVLLLLVASAGGAILDFKDREPFWYTALCLFNGILCITFVLNFFGLLQIGNASIPAALSLLALGYEAVRDVRSSENLSDKEKVLAAAITLALFAPAAVLGFLS